MGHTRRLRDRGDLTGLRAIALLDTLLFSSLWIALAAAALVWVASTALATPGAPLLLAFTGTFVVYNIDRLRDLPRDRATWPRRSGFVSQHRKALKAATALAALMAGALAFWAGPASVLLCLAVLVPGLFHRRLKRHPFFAAFYISLAWVAVTVGLPALSAPLSGAALSALPFVAAVYACCLAANAIASNLRDSENPNRQQPAALHVAQALTLAGALLALAGPSRLAPLAALALCQLAGLVGFGRGERYALSVIDGSLLAGALLAQLAFWQGIP